MDKIKKIWNENRVLFILAIILVVCILIISIVAITYFYGSSDNVYGNRLDVTKKVPLSNQDLQEIKAHLESDAKVSNVTVKLKGKIVYINIDFIPTTNMDEAKGIAETAVGLFSEDELGVYDIQFIISKEKADEVEAYTLMGARNSNGSGTVVWNNYSISEESSVE